MQLDLGARCENGPMGSLLALPAPKSIVLRRSQLVLDRSYVERAWYGHVQVLDWTYWKQGRELIWVRDGINFSILLLKFVFGAWQQAQLTVLIAG